MNHSDPGSTQRSTAGGQRKSSPPVSTGTLQTNPLLARACFSSPGKVRERNEDACSLPPPGANEARWGMLLAVADGVGGLPGGEASSQQAAAYLQALYYAGAGVQDPAARLAECVEAVNALNGLSGRRLGLAQPGLTTLVAAVVTVGQVWIANVGDSRAYLILAASRQRRQLTEDHSSRVQAEKASLVHNSTFARLTDGGSAITRAIGMGEHCQVDSYRYTWQPGDCLVLCSDGLIQLPEQEMIEIVLDQPVEAAARRLVERAVIIDGSDNCTAAVGRWLNAPAPNPAGSSPPETTDNPG